MKILNVNAGGETGGALTHLVFLGQVLKDNGIQNEFLLFEEGTVAKALASNNLSYQVVDQKDKNKWINYINDEKFDLVQTHGPRANFLLSRQRRQINCPHIATVHSDPRYDFLGLGLKGFVQSRLNTWSLKKCDGLFVVAKDLKNEMIRLNIPSSKIIQINNGMEFLTEAPAKLPHSFMEMIIVARLHPVKEHRRLLEALYKLNNPNLKLNIIGDGDLMKELRILTKDLGLSKQVIFYGSLDQKAIADIYPTMDLALLVSKSEGFPLAALEAQNYGVPLLMTELSPTKLLIPNEEVGITVPNSMEGIQAGINKAYNLGEAQLRKIGLNGFNYAKEHFGSEAFYQQIMAGYKIFAKL